MLQGIHRMIRGGGAVLVVLLLIAILATISFGVFTGLQRTTLLPGEARKIGKLLSTACSYAVAENKYYQATIWLDTPSYWIDEIDASGTVVRPKVVAPELLDEMIQIIDITADSTNYTSGLVRIRFSPNKTSDAVTIHMIHKSADPTRDESFCTIKLYAPTARVNIFENQRI